MGAARPHNRRQVSQSVNQQYLYGDGSSGRDPTRPRPEGPPPPSSATTTKLTTLLSYSSGPSTIHGTAHLPHAAPSRPATHGEARRWWRPVSHARRGRAQGRGQRAGRLISEAARRPWSLSLLHMATPPALAVVIQRKGRGRARFFLPLPTLSRFDHHHHHHHRVSFSFPLLFVLSLGPFLRLSERGSVSLLRHGNDAHAPTEQADQHSLSCRGRGAR